MTLAPGTVLGHYRIVTEVGRGGMATVYRAYQESLRREVAVKVLPEFFADDADFRARFAREAAAAARLRHPGIVTVFDYGEEGGIPYIVTEFLEGTTLAALLGSPQPPPRVVELLRPIAGALDYAHEHGVVHRDVKPSNIMVPPDGPPVITDFGLAHIAGSFPRLTRTGTPVGTPEYMSPEQASGAEAGPAADQYALAVIAYELLTGQPPFAGDSPLAVLMAHVNRPPRVPSALVPSLDGRADEVLVRGLAKTPSDRYESAAAFVAALADAVAPGPATEASAATGAPALGRSPSPVGGTAPPGQRGPRADHAPQRGPAVESLQRPDVLLALALFALAVIYLAVLGPVARYREVVALAGALAAVVAVARFLAAYRRESAALEDALVQQRVRVEAAHEREELDALLSTLRSGFAGIGASRALKLFDQLNAEYQQLQPALERRRRDDSLSVARLPALALATYRRGLAVLVDALEVLTAVHSSGRERLVADIAALEEEASMLRSDGLQAERLRLRERALDSYRERLRRLDDLALRSDQLLFEAQRCEASLSQARIDLAAIRVGGSEADVDTVLTALQRTIDQARDVQEEIRMLGL